MKTITTAGKTYNLYWTYGTVEESGKNMETQVSGGGGGGATYGGYGGNTPVHISSKTVIHDQIFLVDEEGFEHSFQLQDMNIACRKGNKLSVIWAIQQGKKKGPYIMAYNHTTGKVFNDEKEQIKMFRRNGPLILLAIVLAGFMGSQVAGGFYILVVAIPIWWVVEGNKARKKFLNETDFKSFK